MSKKNKNTLNRAEVARLLNVSSPTIPQWVNHHGMPCIQRGRKGVEWQFDQTAVVQWYTNYKKNKGNESFDEAQVRKERAHATLAELKVEKAQGKLVEVNKVAGIVEHEYSNLRAKLLSIPNKLAPQLYMIDDLVETQTMIEQAIQEVLEELQADDKDDNWQDTITTSTD